MAAQGRLGEIVHCYARLMHRGGMMWSNEALAGNHTWRGSLEETGRGCFIQLAVHYVHIFEWVTGARGAAAAGFARNLHCPGLAGEDLAGAVLQLDSGAMITLDTAWCADGEELAIHGTGGRIQYRNNRLGIASNSGAFEGRVARYTGGLIDAFDGPFGEEQTIEIRPPAFGDAFNPLNRQGIEITALSPGLFKYVDDADPDTGHRVIRLSQAPGTASLYFNQNAYTADGKSVIVTTPDGGIATIDLKTGAIAAVVAGRVNVIVAGRKTGQVYYMKDGAIFATNVTTKATRQIAKLEVRGSVATLNADETLLAGTFTENQVAPQAGRGGAGAGRGAGAQPLGADGKPLNKADAKEVMLDNRLNQHTPMGMFTVDVRTGEVNTFYRATDWLNHLQFSPTDPTLLMFCHEGPWHKVDRIWTIRTDGTQLTKIHTRTLDMEIAGHEFWSNDGKTIWYDLQTPRGEDFWVAGYNIDSRERVWYHLDRDEWSVHFNVSPDGKLFAGDGGDNEMVAHAKDGKWIYLFRPEMVPNYGVANEQKGLIKTGVLRSERLVNMAKHNYALEPNVSFTPDMKWLVFRTNMFGGTQVLAVEIEKPAK